MQEVKVELPPGRSRGYTIYVGKDLSGRLGSLLDLNRYSSLFVVTDDAVPAAFLKDLLAPLPQGTSCLKLPSGDRNKGMNAVQKIWTALHEAGCDRKSLVINLGGGVIGDLGGFAASTYMRGVDFVNVPTTLLSQVDASIGGKTGFNFAGVKNLVGTFDQPAGVVIDVNTIGSLPERELVSGFAEVIKHGLIHDRHYFDQATSKKPAEFSPDELTDIISGSCRIKLAIIKDDIRESGARKLVNFGHSVGHAVEALSHEVGRPLLHGEAISIGMAAEAGIAVKLGLLDAGDLESVVKALRNAGLPVSVRGMEPVRIIAKMRSDKKNVAGRLNFTLIDRIGHAIYDQQVPETTVIEALHTVLER